MTSEVQAEMAATVWRVLVAEGENVKAGDEIVILESMKMEVPIITETAGILKELRVGEGSSVQKGDVIAVIESE